MLHRHRAQIALYETEMEEEREDMKKKTRGKDLEEKREEEEELADSSKL